MEALCCRSFGVKGVSKQEICCKMCVALGRGGGYPGEIRGRWCLCVFVCVRPAAGRLRGVTLSRDTEGVAWHGVGHTPVQLAEWRSG